MRPSRFFLANCGKSRCPLFFAFTFGLGIRGDQLLSVGRRDPRGTPPAPMASRTGLTVAAQPLTIPDWRTLDPNCTGEVPVSYTVLARKYRSRTFDEVIGQEPIATTLVNAIKTGRLHHGYLFTGTRGSGKTSMARILAKALNCLKS